jgi:dipeptidyl aminopeptidase/acylaminoacyl peptidase
MPTTPKSTKWIGALVAAAALLALPSAAGATLTFVRNPLNPSVFLAGDDGQGAKKVDAGRAPRISPDGLSLIYLHEGPGHAQEMKVTPVAGGPTRTLLRGWQETSYLAFSFDSQSLLALEGAELGKRSLVLIDIPSGLRRTVADGYFSGFSFSPDGEQIVFARAGSQKFPPRSDVFRASASGGRFVALTRDHRSLAPLWGPSGKIVFVKQLEAKRRKYGPKNELYLMNEGGRQVKRLTHTKVDQLLLGLSPTEWSGNGARLLAEFEGQDTSYAVSVNPRTGAQRPLDRKREGGFVGTALSADGTTVLGFTGGFEPGPDHNVASVPYSGGKKTVLAKNAFEPDWSR